MVDDLNNYVGCLRGPAKTPHIDRLASEGMLFTNAHCVVPACNPSRVALLTGQRSETTGQYANPGNFREKPGGMDRITLPQFLTGKGYDAVAAGKIFHHPHGTEEEPRSLSDPISWDFQWRGDIGTPGAELFRDDNGLARWHGGIVTGYFGTHIFFFSFPYTVKETCDWQITEFCAEYLDRNHEKPFFLACGIYRPHSPQIVPKEFFDMYPIDEVELPVAPEDDMEDVPEGYRENFTAKIVKPMKELGEWRNAVQGYLASASFADFCVGNILNALKESRYFENTIVILAGDHGWHIGDKERIEKFTLWNQSTQVPLIIKVPGLEAGKCDRAVSLLDIYPTVVDLLGFELPEYLEGVNIGPWLSDPSAPKEEPAISLYREGNYSVKVDEWNYISYDDGGEELYNLADDPHELRNLVADPAYAKQKARMLQYFVNYKTNKGL